MPRSITLSALAMLFSAGLLLAAVVAATGNAADTTTTETTSTVETTTSGDTTTEVTVPVTTTVQITTTRPSVTITRPGTTTPTTTASSSSSSGTAAWVWVLIGILAAGLTVVIALLATRGRGGKVPAEERRRRLDGAVATWAAQGWALESQSADSAVLRRGEELMLVSVDDAGHVSTRPLASS